MAQGIQRLSAEQVRRVVTVGHTAILSDGGGLRLVVHANGSKYWQFRTAAGGKETTLQIGRYPNIGLAEARAEAAKIRKQVSNGLDPALERKVRAVRQKVAKAATFRAVADELLAVKEANGLSVSYRAKIEGAVAQLLHAIPCVSCCPVRSVARPAILRRHNRGDAGQVANTRFRGCGQARLVERSRSPQPTSTCGTKRDVFLVIGLASSRMPTPHDRPATIQAPTTA